MVFKSAVSILLFITYACSIFIVSLHAAEVFVQTNASVTLQEGTRGVVPCNVQRKLYAGSYIYWKKGDELILYVDLHYNVGHKSGQGFTSGRFDITTNGSYSLIVRNATRQDEGRYICEVSDMDTGSIFKNGIQVFVKNTEDFIVKTAPSITATAGANVTLPCIFVGTALEVTWKKTSPSHKSVLTVLEYPSAASEYSSAPAGKFSWAEPGNFSLLIQDLQPKDAANYTCYIEKDWITLENTTELSVQDEQYFRDSTIIYDAEKREHGKQVKTALAVLLPLFIIAAVGVVLAILLTERGASLRGRVAGWCRQSGMTA